MFRGELLEKRQHEGGGEIAGREAAHGEDFQGKKQQEESAEGAVG